MTTPVLPNSWLPAVSKELMESGAAHLAHSNAGGNLLPITCLTFSFRGSRISSCKMFP